MQTQAGLTHIFMEGVYAKMNHIVEAMGRIPDSLQNRQLEATNSKIE